MKNFLIPLAIRLFPGIIWMTFITGCSSPVPVTLTFNAYVDGAPLEYGKPYPSPNGDGTYSITDFKVYVSSLRFLHSDSDSNDYIVEDSYHLLKFQDTSSYSITLDWILSLGYDSIGLSVGIDSAANLSIDNPGDLDPTNQMAWNWTAGYKFLLLEGIYTPKISGQIIPLVYHIGFSENKKDLKFACPSTPDIRFAVELGELFKNPSFIDFHVLPKVLFNETDAAIISLNYANDFIKIDSY